MPDIIINDKVKQAHFDEEEIIVGPNDDENLAVNNIVPTDGLSCTKYQRFVAKCKPWQTDALWQYYNSWWKCHPES